MNTTLRRDLSQMASTWILLCVALLLTVIVYYPSLRGGFIFDDSVYLVDNTDAHLTSLTPGGIWRATISQCSINPSCRPLSSLTFAANYYFSGLDPFWLKLTNLAIHLLNGVLSFLLFRELFRIRASQKGETETHDRAALAIASLWLLLPINLTAVAYASQRMEELAIGFVFLGIYLYLRSRRRLFLGEGGLIGIWVAILFCTVLGLSAKEDAALLPLMTACVEFSLLAFRNKDRSVCKSAIWVHVALLVVPAIVGMAWLTHRLSGVSAYRDFTIVERLFTETRVLIDYIVWTLFPNLNSLTFYHDDLAVSHGLFDPTTTFVSLLAIVALIAIALYQRATRPLFCLGILWFFAAHSMTATVVPLELVFEHRNYLPSAGLLLAAVSILAFDKRARLSALLPLIAIGFLAFYAFITFLRAEEWSNPLRLAYAEALKRPDSVRAQYDLGRALIIAAQLDDKSPLVDKATEVLLRNAARPDSGITALQALIYLNGHAHRPVDPRWWSDMVERLRNHAPSQSDIAAIIFLYRCQASGDCPLQTDELLQVFVTALDRSNGNSNLMASYADFALTQLGDEELAERTAHAVADGQPLVAVYRINLIQLLLAINQPDKAETELTTLKGLNRFNSLDAQIAKLENEIAQRRAPREPEPGSPNP